MDELIQNLKSEIEYLNKINIALSTIDLVISFAKYSQSLPVIVRPNFERKIELTDAANPILQNFSSKTRRKSLFKELNPLNKSTLVANSILATESAPFMLITGANMSGKSTFLKQIGALQVLSQCGCFVPAEKATLSLSKQILSRAGDDYDKLNKSSFEQEMLEMNYVLENMKHNSVILIDELCRCTNTNEGLALSISICEFMLNEINRLAYENDQNLFVFYASHFFQTASLEFLYPSMKTVYMESAMDKKQRLSHSYKMRPGVNNQENYGLLKILINN